MILSNSIELLKETKHQDTFLSNSTLVLNPSKSDISIILNKTDSKFINCYDQEQDQMILKSSLLVHSKFSKFVLKIPKKLLVNLDSIIEINRNYKLKRGWLLFFTINSKPMFCFTEETMIFP